MSQQLNFFEPISEQTKQPDGNKRLVAGSLPTEGSDYRVHVGYKTQHIYIFPTKSAQEYVKARSVQEAKTVKTGTIVTSKGYAAPISHIDGLRDIMIPPDIYRSYVIVESMLTSAKGALAQSITVDMLKRNLIPLPFSINVVDDKSIQFSGTDIIINSEIRLQVKCDFKAGHKHLGGTGNVYLEVAECNPYRRY